MNLLGRICTSNIRIPFLDWQMKNTKNKIYKMYKLNNTWLYEELGIYSSNPEKDKKINDELKSFLKSIGCKPVRRIITNE